MIKIKIYDTDGTVREAECELLAVCGFTRPGGILYRFQTDFMASRGETFACLAHLSAQLQAAARDAMQEAVKLAEADGIELDDEFMRNYEKAVYGIEKQINRSVGQGHGEEAEDDEADS